MAVRDMHACAIHAMCGIVRYTLYALNVKITCEALCALYVSYKMARDKFSQSVFAIFGNRACVAPSSQACGLCNPTCWSHLSESLISLRVFNVPGKPCKMKSRVRGDPTGTRATVTEPLNSLRVFYIPATNLDRFPPRMGIAFFDKRQNLHFSKVL